MFWAEPFRAHLLRLYVLLTAALLPFVIWPGIDLAVARIFYVPGEGFPLDELAWLQVLRNQLWNLSIAGFLAGLAGLAWAEFRASMVLARLSMLVTAFYLTGPVLLSHALFKEEWHRARPANILEFGGPGQFTGPLEQPGSCLDNCSFVSGEVSGMATLALSLIWVLPALPSLRWRRAVAGIAVALVLLSAGLRMAMGRHFFSDCLFAVLFMFALWSLFSRALPAGWKPLASLRAAPEAPTPPPGGAPR